MKKTALIIVFIIAAALLCSCKAEGESSMKTESNKTVDFVNGVTDADIWILPQTDKNLKTSVWGTATASKVKTGESVRAPLCEPGDGGLYILRMIDTAGFYYSANGIRLADGWTMQVREDKVMSVTLEVKNNSGAVDNTYEVFSAKL